MENKYKSNNLNKSNYKTPKPSDLDNLEKSFQGLKKRLNSESTCPFTRKVVMEMRG